MNHAGQAKPESPPPMDPRIRDIQPGGGVIIRLEKAWGVWRRWWLKRFRKAYVSRMLARRQGEPTGVPHEVLDPRDLKLFRNQTDCHWRPEDDPFAWRDRLPFVRAGLAELIVISALAWPAAVLFSVAAGFFAAGFYLRIGFGILAFGFSLIGLGVAWFFRNPRRTVPAGPGEVVAPADGKVVGIEQVDDPFLGGPAREITIFLSVFNVHINRAPVAARVVGIEYQPGKYLNALRPESSRENEQLAVRLEEEASPFRRAVVRQITGAIARRIVCWIKPGDRLQRGEAFGMIKLGSRTVLVIPDDGRLNVIVRVGDKVRAGSSILARYEA
jgi:phosphatidylserine decarboxylase